MIYGAYVDMEKLQHANETVRLANFVVASLIRNTPLVCAEATTRLENLLVAAFGTKHWQMHGHVQEGLMHADAELVEDNTIPPLTPPARAAPKMAGYEGRMPVTGGSEVSVSAVGRKCLSRWLFSFFFLRHSSLFQMFEVLSPPSAIGKPKGAEMQSYAAQIQSIQDALQDARDQQNEKVLLRVCFMLQL